MPLALEGLDLSAYDLVISSESGPAKGVITRPDATHVCYCHTPMRYLWDQYHVYRSDADALTRAVMSIYFHRMRQWDVTSAARVDRFIANSRFVRDRIRKYYRREAEIVPPPVDLSSFNMSTESDGYYLFVGELVPYKRADIAITACTAMGRDLVVVGHGSEFQKLKSLAGPKTRFLGHVDAPTLRSAYARCRALLYPGTEDFGIIPLEAMASGKPVIAFGKGGILDTVVDRKTGLLYREESISALMDAIERFEKECSTFDPAVARARAELFSVDSFKENIRAIINSALQAQSAS
jgi:glycosyltransferase involved in cell wall biosynthesis